MGSPAQSPIHVRRARLLRILIVHAHVEGDTKQTKCENKVIEVGFLWGKHGGSYSWFLLNMGLEGHVCSTIFVCTKPKNDPSCIIGEKKHVAPWPHLTFE